MHPNVAVRNVLPKYKIGEINVETVPHNQVGGERGERVRDRGAAF